MFTFRRLAFVLFILLFVSWAPVLFAQGGATGAISGTVQDQSGGIVAGAQITVVSEATGQVVRDLTTDSAGSFTATLLPVGSYSVGVTFQCRRRRWRRP